MTVEQARLLYEELLMDVDSDPERATSIERDIMTAAILAIESGDFTRAKGLASVALSIQQIPFRRM